MSFLPLPLRQGLMGGRSMLAGLGSQLAAKRCPVCAAVTAAGEASARREEQAGDFPRPAPDAGPANGHPAGGAAAPDPGAPVEGLCPECAGRLKLRSRGFCPGCAGLAEVADGPVSLCGECRLRPRAWTAVGFFGEYGGELRELVLGLKFGGRLSRLALLRDIAWRAYAFHRERADGFSPQGPDLVTAVPMHWRRLMARGYNQSLELARGVAARLGAGLSPEALRKVRHTTPQSRLSARERRANLDGAFAAERGLVGGKNVLLVDDVMTTGTTLEAASRALFASGAARVEVLVLARD